MLARKLCDRSESEESIDAIVKEIVGNDTSDSTAKLSRASFKSKLQTFFRRSSHTSGEDDETHRTTLRSSSSGGDNWNRFIDEDDGFEVDRPCNVRFQMCTVKRKFVDKAVQTDPQPRSAVGSKPIPSKAEHIIKNMSNDDEKSVNSKLVPPRRFLSTGILETFFQRIAGNENHRDDLNAIASWPHSNQR